MTKIINFFSAKTFIIHILFQICIATSSAWGMMMPSTPLQSWNSYRNPLTPPPTLGRGPNLEILWECKRNPEKINQDQCIGEMHFFCSGYCTRLNCAILSNRSICLDVCNVSNPLIVACVEAGVRNKLIQHPPPPQSPTGTAGAYPPGAPMDPTMMAAMGLMAAAPLIGEGIGAAAKGIGSAASATSKGLGSAAKKTSKGLGSATKKIGKLF